MNRFLLTLALAASVASAADDTIKLKTGDVKGKITRLEIDGITYEVQGQAKTVRPDEIAGFVLGDPPSKQKEAETKVNARDFPAAIAAYNAAYTDASRGGRGDVYKQFILLGLARAQRATNDLAGALATLSKMRKECPKAYAYVEGAREALDIAKKLGDDAKARDVLNEMRAAAEPIKGYGEVEAARKACDDKDYAAASKALTAVLGNSSQPYAADAKALNIRVLRGQKNWQALETFCRAILPNKSTTPPSLMQAACAGLGDSLMDKAKSDKAALHDAIVSYAEAISIGPPGKGQPADDYVDALLNSARAVMLAGQGAGKPEALAAATARAQGYYAEVLRQYQGTDWANTAKSEMDALGGGGGEPK